MLTFLAEHLSTDPEIGELNAYTLCRWMIEEELKSYGSPDAGVRDIARLDHAGRRSVSSSSGTALSTGRKARKSRRQRGAGGDDQPGGSEHDEGTIHVDLRLRESRLALREGQRLRMR
jgi:hypothetical protein